MWVHTNKSRPFTVPNDVLLLPLWAKITAQVVSIEKKKLTVCRWPGSCLTSPPSCYKLTVNHGFLRVIALLCPGVLQRSDCASAPGLGSGQTCVWFLRAAVGFSAGSAGRWSTALSGCLTDAPVPRWRASSRAPTIALGHMQSGRMLLGRLLKWSRDEKELKKFIRMLLRRDCWDTINQQTQCINTAST